jgi:diguanylate cyclase (GGDEF)-like protein
MNNLYLFDDNTAHASMLADYMAPYGYEVATFADPQAFLDGVARHGVPHVALIAVESATDPWAGTKLAEKLRAQWTTRFPILFFSGRDDFAVRLATVRAGGASFIAKPIDLVSLVDRLDQITEVNPPQPFRILLVDDDPILSRLYELALRNAGMDVFTIPNPTHAIAAIHDHDPDLLITDLSMPECNGLELAAVIHGHEALAALPIVFLTADQKVDTRRSAVNLGGDAYLTKPVQIPELVETVRARAKRARQLRSLMVRDSLTGAFNHAMIKELLESEVIRAKRDSSELCLAMIDIDHFKHVNDTYGHTTGDRVIKSLVRLLQQQLRRTDYIGRYGGEEFAIILPKMSIDDAFARLEHLRQAFAAIPHRREDELFHVTFSAGIIAFDASLDAASMTEMADAALYQAKRRGRNQVARSDA